MSGAAEKSTSPVVNTTPKPAQGQVLDTAEAEKVLPLPLMLREVMSTYNKPMTKLLAEFASLNFGRSGLSPEEYFKLRLFDEASLKSPPSSFAGNRGMARIWKEANYDFSWHGVINDKLAFDTLLAGLGYPAIKTRAYYHAEGGHAPAIRALRTADDLRAYLTEPGSYPFFSKPHNSSLSLGSFSAAGYDAASDTIKLTSGKTCKLPVFIADIVAHYGDGYMFQERAVPHATVRAICGDRLPTVRVFTVMSEEGPKLFRAVWKIPAGKNMADNFWRKGNILAAIDYETGRITRAITGTALEMVELEQHPDSKHQLKGIEVPNFKAVVQLAIDAHRMLKGLNLVGWDIAPTDAGGLIVEANVRPDFKLVQIAEARGIIDAGLDAFLAYCSKVKKDRLADAKAKSKAHLAAERDRTRKSASLRKVA